MKLQSQVALVSAAMLYLLWGLGLWFVPRSTHALLTGGFYNAGVSALFGASLLAMAVLFVIAARHVSRPLVHAAAAALLLVGLTAGYQMFLVHSVSQGPATVVSLILTLAIGLFLVIAASDGVQGVETNGRTRKRARGARRAMTPRRA